MKLSLAAGLAVYVSLANAFKGKMTHYTPALGSCGLTHGDGDAVVALSKEIMQNGPNPNANRLVMSMLAMWCGTKIVIRNLATGSATQATIVDTCYGCAKYDIDVSTGLFKIVAPGADGTAQIEWGGEAIGG
ncbi:hypothetical protein N7G274_006691 [Stereocaulon virgatum]|uniref:Uncharacterized protein n=1 Tax=Stereocaulon virgatum TaxID=373712 RepID=A0ABR4A8K3_9LECA